MTKASEQEQNSQEQKNTELARRCLALIRDIAERGVLSWDPEHVGYALQELSQVLLERLGIEDRIFEPVPAMDGGRWASLPGGRCTPGRH
jgi:hypothetical protein